VTRRFTDCRDATLLLAILLLALISPAGAAPLERGRVTVVDGDTIQVAGELVRLVGFNTPEIRSAECPRERALGNAAARRLRQLVAGEGLDFTYVRCACLPGTEGTARCNYGRRCGVLRARGRDVGQILVAEALAVPFRCGATSCPELPRPWCGSDRL
jgi:endonuclease YncB( thermonuclease family)